MSGMGGALPHPGQQPPFNAPATYGYSETPGATSPQFYYQMQQHAQQFQSGRGMQQQYGPATQSVMMTRPHLTFQPPGQYGQFDPFSTYNVNQFQVPPVDPRASHNPYGMFQGSVGDMGQYVRRASEPAPIPSFPRGPPRKPKQSGHALWVGNLPPAATIIDLKDHFSRDATKDIESLFLISKSNCAFVNYRSEAACVAAMNRFHDSRFHGVRLVCRLRRGAATGPSPPALGGGIIETSSPSEIQAAIEEPSSPTIVGRPNPITTPSQASAMAEASDRPPKIAEKFFVVKSLTVQDLESSVRNSTWATQSHNESTLNRAYEEADSVYLIFSANKSGEYFGYARMTSKISGEPVSLGTNFAPAEPQSPGAPQSISTSATATAPKGRIIDDSARGTIFWEAEHSDDDEVESLESETSEASEGQNWGKQFAIEWISQARLPFYRTRGLRNPWNANREVKIARDGTEIEPSVGRRLVQMFHRPAAGPGGPQMQGRGPFG